MDIEECLGVAVLGLVDPWLQFSVFLRMEGRSLVGLGAMVGRGAASRGERKFGDRQAQPARQL